MGGEGRAVGDGTNEHVEEEKQVVPNIHQFIFKYLFSAYYISCIILGSEGSKPNNISFYPKDAYNIVGEANK